MKIDPGLKPVTLPPLAETRPATPPTLKGTSSEQTQVSLSPRAAQLQLQKTQLASIPVVDRARVDSIKAIIAAGQYVIKSENIADSLLGSAKEILHVAK